MNSHLESEFIKIIKIQAKANNLSHAYLVFGHLDTISLLKLLQVKSPDTFLIQEKPIKINNIRELIGWLYLKPHSSSRKIAILHKVENMTLEAANSLLKVLEEAPVYAVLVLQADKKEKILPTILSRCQIIYEKKRPVQKVPENYIASDKIAKMSLKERFDYINKLIKQEEDILKFINLWEEEYRQQMLAGQDVKETLRYISKIRHLLSTNTSVKFLLENLLLKF